MKPVVPFVPAGVYSSTSPVTSQKQRTRQVTCTSISRDDGVMDVGLVWLTLARTVNRSFDRFQWLCKAISREAVGGW